MLALFQDKKRVLGSVPFAGYPPALEQGPGVGGIRPGASSSFVPSKPACANRPVCAISPPGHADSLPSLGQRTLPASHRGAEPRGARGKPGGPSPQLKGSRLCSRDAAGLRRSWGGARGGPGEGGGRGQGPGGQQRRWPGPGPGAPGGLGRAVTSWGSDVTRRRMTPLGGLGFFRKGPGLVSHPPKTAAPR